MLKKISFYFLLITIFSCSNETSAPEEKPEGDADAARMLLRAVLDGRWKDAKTLVVQDETNFQYLDVTEQRFTRMPVDSVRSYRQSQIHFFHTRRLNDSASIITYSNSFTNQKDSIKVVKFNGYWLVDFKFKFLNDNTQ